MHRKPSSAALVLATLAACRVPVPASSSLAAGAAGRADAGGFVARVGTDTVVVERLTRVGDALAVEQVRRSPQPRLGLVLPPGAGERLTYCERPLALTLKVDSAAAPTTRLLAGVGELRGDEGIGRHRTADEILYVIRGWGHAVLGGDTVPLGPGSMAYVPPGAAHRLVSRGAAPMEYFFVLGPASSAEGFRRAAALGCPGGAAAAAARRATAAPPPPEPTADGRRAVWFEPGAGDRISYCPFPLVITTKVDSASAAGTRLTAAAGSLRRGSEVGTHAGRDEVVYVTHGRGRAFIGADTAVVEAGSVTFVPQGTLHGFVNDGEGTLEYVVVYGGGFSPAGFRRLAARPGPYCPGAR